MVKVLFNLLEQTLKMNFVQVISLYTTLHHKVNGREMTKSLKRRCDQLGTLALTHLKDVHKANNVIFLFLQTSTNIVEMVLVVGKICKQLTLTAVSK